jgi:PEP-CTERM motif-containing protein
MRVRCIAMSPLIAAAALLFATASSAATYNITIDGSDAIFLAGRTDVVIPDPSLPWNTGTHLVRHATPTPEEIRETLPPFVAVSAGDVVRVLDPAAGGISFFNGFGPPLFGPAGNGASGSNLTALDGISGYIGPQGALSGVFLNDSIPLSGAPATLDFTPGGLGTSQPSLSPLLGQVFYIGNGLSGGSFKEFVAPAGATRLFLGIPDGFGFNGPPGAYDDNDGAYRIVIGVNQVPVPEPQTYGMLALGLTLLAGIARRRLT